jgi:hypothetical protein
MFNYRTSCENTVLCIETAIGGRKKRTLSGETVRIRILLEGHLEILRYPFLFGEGVAVEVIKAGFFEMP